MRAPSSRPRYYRLDTLRFHAFRVQSLLATDVPGVGAVVLCALILFWSGLTQQAVAYERDTYAFYVPLTDWFAEQLRAGHFAFWTPLVFGGYPLFADGEIGVFYPLNLLLLPFVPADLLLTPLRALHLVIAGVGMMRFLLALGLGRPGAVVGGIVFGFCGFLVAQIAHENVVRTAVWLPWILLCVERGLQGRGNVRSLVLGGLVAGIAMLGVHIQPVIMIALATVLFAAWRLFVAADCVAKLSPIRRLVLLAGTPVLVFGIGLGIAAIQWLPLWELAKLSPRGEGFDPNAALAIGLRWQNFATLLFPQLFRLDDGRSMLLWDDWEGMLFVGVISLGLMPIAVHRGDRRRCAFFGGLGLLAFLAACGDASPIPVARWLLYLPGMSLVRIPARYTFLVTFAVAGLAAEGANAVASVRGRSWGLVVSGAGVLAATVVVAFTVLLLRDQLLVDPAGWKQRISDGYVDVPNARTYLSADLVYGQLVRSLDPVQPAVGGSLGLLAGLGVLLVTWGLRPRQRSWWVGLLILLVGVDALRYGLPFHPRGRLDQLMQPPKVLDLVKAHEQPVRVLVATRDDTVLANRLAGAQIQTLDGYSSLPDGRNLAYVGHLFDGGTSLLDLAAVRYLVVDRELVTPPDDENGVVRAEPGSISKELRTFVQSAALPVIAADRHLAVLENLHSFNRAYVVPSAIPARSGVAALTTVSTSRIGWDDRPAVEGLPDPIGEPHDAAHGSLPAAGLPATVEDVSPDKLRVRVPDGPGGVLVLADAYHPGWHASVDGVPTTVYPANGMFRAVSLPPHAREVDFTFAPWSLQLGAGVSLVTLLSIGLILALAPALERRQRARRMVCTREVFGDGSRMTGQSA